MLLHFLYVDREDVLRHRQTSGFDRNIAQSFGIQPMIFGGIFKIWFGGKSKARRIAILRTKLESQDSEDDNLPAPDEPAVDQGDPTRSRLSVLAFDRNGDGAIDPNSELSLLQDASGATSNFDALKSFDANSDNYFDIDDPQFQKCGIWLDANQDGQFQDGEFRMLDQLGVKSIDLAKGLTDGAVSFMRLDGSEGLLKLAPSSATS